jgi:hypothetical protein
MRAMRMQNAHAAAAIAERDQFFTEDLEEPRGVSVSSIDMQTGCQNARMYSPIGVPGPVSVNSGSWPGTLFT